MRIAVFSTKPYDEEFLLSANTEAGAPHELEFHRAHLSEKSAALAQGSDAICAFVNDCADRPALEVLRDAGVRLICLRSAGFNNVDLAAARDLGLAVARVPAYSPHAIAEHTVAILLSLVRKIHRSYARVREGNFSLDGLLGFDLAGRTVGVVGTGKIGMCVARILTGFGCEVLGTDPLPNGDFHGRYVALDELLESADIVTLHCPLTPETHHLIDAQALSRMKDGVTIINTSRGAVIDTQAIIAALKTRKIGLLGLDVYEEEENIFFEDMSRQAIMDDTFARLLTFPNVLITGHQGFFTTEALEAIARITIANASAFERDGRPLHSAGLRPSDQD